MAFPLTLQSTFKLKSGYEMPLLGYGVSYHHPSSPSPHLAANAKLITPLLSIQLWQT